MDLLLDTHVLVWTMGDATRLSADYLHALAIPDNRLFVSAVTAFEYVDLHKRGRLPAAVPFDLVAQRLRFDVLDCPAECWQYIGSLPDIHRDPVDRMLIAHAIALDMTLVTADRALQQYPLRILW